jgi:hypothetical protein
MIDLWRIRLHTTADHNWCGYFMYAPTPQDIRDILERIPHCPTPLLELAVRIPDDCVNLMTRTECPSIMYRTEIGTIRIRKEEAHARRRQDSA